MENITKSVVGLLGATISFLFGGWSLLLQVLVFFIVLDYVLGVLVAGTYGKLSSKVGFRGIAKKVLILALVAVAYSIDKIMGDGTFIRDAVIFFYLANELLSILETVGKTNLPIPDILKKAVETLSNKSKGDD
ncbi:phage holin family protein [Gracilibacillus alcaliphilus]|uniref:phage holin family protein n=1 Tax=Gracilibacillus alcaliphilus TaxID=1401441 RepID=UPI00195E4E6D|nr:phage holin family protein [Gracilibacillus alcaliphilus]MBM7678985.1 toxin secretion/phage lysis holin [Gracilibacillus alcaliphilus]